MIALVIRLGLLAAFLGALAAAAMGLVASRRQERIWAHRVLGGASGLGALCAAAFLLFGLAPAEIARSPLLFGAPLAVDRLSAFFLLLLHVVSALTAWFAAHYAEEDRGVTPVRAVVPLTAVFIWAMQGVLLSTGLASFLLFWEAMSLASFFLVMVDGQDASRRAALLYLAVAQFGAGALLVGLGLLSGGDLFSTLSRLPGLAGGLTPNGAALATGLLLFAFGSKAGVAPLHAWLPEAHPRAPSPVSALMSGVMLKVALYGLIRFASVCWPDLSGGWGIALMALGLSGAAVAAMSANLARDIKRVLAWSSVEHIGLIVTMFGFSVLLRSRALPGLAEAVMAAMYLHILAHALFKAGLFLAAGAIIHETHTGKIEALGGLANRMPRLSAAALALALAACALPPSGTFVAEWQLLQAAVMSMWSGQPGIVATGIVLLIGFGFVAGLGVFAMVRLFSFVFLAEPRSDESRQAVEPSPALWQPVAVTASAVMLLGLVGPWMGPLLPVPPAPLSFALPVAGGAVATTSSAAAAGLAVALAFAAGLGWLAARRLTGPGRIRAHHTWDCGQPIDATMEYTATAFSAPVRFFLRDLMRAEKHLSFEAVLPTNRWIRRGRMEFRSAEGVLERLYYPIAALIEGVGARLRRLQNGVIQFYIALVLATLLITLWVAL